MTLSNSFWDGTNWVRQLKYTSHYRTNISINSSGFTPLMTFRRKPTSSLANLFIGDFSFFTPTPYKGSNPVDAILQIRLNPVINSTNWIAPADQNNDDTFCQVNVDATTITGGDLIYTLIVPASTYIDEEIVDSLVVPIDTHVTLCARAIAYTAPVTGICNALFGLREYW